MQGTRSPGGILSTSLSCEQEPQLARFRPRVTEAMRLAGYRVNNLDVRRLAEASGVRPDTLWHFLRGERLPSAVSLVRLSRALNVPTDWLLGGPVCGGGYWQ